MRLINSKRNNPFRSAVDEFARDNFNVSFRSIRSVTSSFYRWLASTRFKVKGNTQTNPHTAAINFYTEHEAMLNRYGNVFEVNANRFFNLNPRPLSASRAYELKTGQYVILGQEYAEFDIIKYVDISDTVVLELNHQQQVFEFFHDAGDAPVFVTAGYSIVNAKTGKTYYVIENEPVTVDILFNTFVVTLNDNEDDIRNNEKFLDCINEADPSLGMEAWYGSEPRSGYGEACEVPATESDSIPGGNADLYWAGYAQVTAVNSLNLNIGTGVGGGDFSRLRAGGKIFIDGNGENDYTEYDVSAVADDFNVTVVGPDLVVDTICKFYYRKQQYNSNTVTCRGNGDNPPYYRMDKVDYFKNVIVGDVIEFIPENIGPPVFSLYEVANVVSDRYVDVAIGSSPTLILNETYGVRITMPVP